MASPICEVKDGAAAYVSTTDGVNVTPGNTIVIHLASSADVDSWGIECLTTDDLSDAAAINAALVIDAAAKTATFTAPVEGRAYRFRSQVGSGSYGLGRDRNNVAQPTFTTTFGVYTLVSSNRVHALDETLESGAAGWAADINAIIRAGGGGGSASVGAEGDPQLSDGAGGLTAVTIAGNAGKALVVNPTEDGMVLEELAELPLALTNIDPDGDDDDVLTLVAGVPTWQAPAVPSDDLTEEVNAWTPPTATADEAIVSVAKYGTAANTTPFAAVTFVHEDETAADYVATVLARDATGHNFRLDLRAAYESTDATFTDIGAPATAEPLAANPGTWAAVFSRSGSDVRVWLTLAADVRWSVLAKAQIVSLDSSPAAFDLDSLAWSGNWKLAYAGSPWTDSVSTGGTSGSRTITEATNPPTAGQALGGLNSAVFDGSNDELVTTNLGTTLCTAAAGTICLLYYVTNSDLVASSGGSVGDAFGDKGMIADAGAFNFAISINSTGPRIFAYDGGNKGIQYTGGTATGWHLLQIKWDGTTLHMRVDSGAWSTTACGNLFIGTAWKLGEGCSGVHRFKGAYREFRTAPTAFSNGTLDNVKSGFNSKYALSL